jgi:hypothetical protein
MTRINHFPGSPGFPLLLLLSAYKVHHIKHIRHGALTFTYDPVSGVSGVAGTFVGAENVGAVGEDVTDAEPALVLVKGVTPLAPIPVATVTLGLKASTMPTLVPRHRRTVICN